MTVTIDVLTDPARACAALMLGAALGNGHIVLTGGSTPRIAYEHFVSAVQTVGIDLSGTTMWIGDERCVEVDDERSNYRMIRESMLDPLAARGDGSAPAVHRMKGELGPDAGADDYERVLREAGLPKFDLLLLGIGSDGHCASLFPDKPALDERERLVVGVPEAGLEPFVPRISLTLPALTGARHVVFLASGEGKADAVARAFGPGVEPTRSVPSSIVASEAAQVTVLVDAAAASKLGPGAAR